MKIYLHLMNAPHPAYLELLASPPPNVEYSYRKVLGAYGQGKPGKDSLLRTGLKAIYSPMPAVHYARPSGKVDLIHSTNGLMLMNNSPWVMDVEHVGALLRFKPERYGSGIYRSVISSLLRRKQCKGILCWSDAAKKSLENYLGKGDRSTDPAIRKAHVVYPAMRLSQNPAKKPDKTFRFLFVGKNFYEKGGRETLVAFEKARAKIDCSLTFIGNVPEEYRKRYEGSVTFLEPKFGRAEMAEMFSSHHALVFPTYMDTFGFVILEAMAAGLPVISTKLFCIPELVEDGKTGILIDPPISWHDERFQYRYRDFPKWDKFVSHIRDSNDLRFDSFAETLAKRMVSLASDAGLWKSMSAVAIEKTTRGPLSVDGRNQALEDAYRKATGG
jgi:glycosyltransferase involved in cell wall biosynthesis